MSLLEVRDLKVAYGAVQAIKGISLDVEEGQVVTLIGANGAGKTTTLRALSGYCSPTAGEIRFDGKPLNGVPAHEIVTRGIAHAPEGRKIFPLMTVEENLDLGGFSRKGQALAKDVDEVFERFPRLRERRTQKAGTLSGGEQQMLAIGRALMSRPRLLMLDEPSMGLAPIMIQTGLRDHRGAEGSRLDDPARRAERRGRSVARRPGLRPGDRQGRARGHRQGAAQRRQRAQGLPRRGLAAPADVVPVRCRGRARSGRPTTTSRVARSS